MSFDFWRIARYGLSESYFTQIMLLHSSYARNASDNSATVLLRFSDGTEDKVAVITNLLITMNKLSAIFLALVAFLTGGVLGYCARKKKPPPGCFFSYTHYRLRNIFSNS